MAEFFKDMDIDVYHAQTDVLSKSMLSKFADCPARYKHLFIDGGEQKKTKSLRLGNAVHVLALEPELWKAGYHVMPATYFNDKGEEKDWRNDARMQVVQDQYQAAGYEIVKEKGKGVEFKESPGCKVILTLKEYEQVEQMSEALTKDTYALSLLKSPGYVESSIFWESEVEDPATGEVIIDPATGEPLIVKKRCRPDLLRNDSLLVDLKIARSVKPSLFHNDAFNLHYDLSVALSFEGFEALHQKEPDNYVFVAVEQEAPFIVECFESLEPMDDLTGLTYLDYGRMHLKKLMADFARCRAENVWPKYQKKIGGMKVPGWAIKQFIEKGI